MAYKIPLFDLNYGQDEIDAFKQCVDDNWISIGPKCAKFEETFSKMLGAKHAVSCDNCTNALFMAMLALGIKKGDEVLVPSLTFAATVNCVKYVGATPVFVDVVSESNLHFDPKDAARKITSRTKAMIPMQYAGFPCDMDAIMRLAKKHGLHVVEDACHGPLSEYKGRKLGTIGDIGCFSFFSNKNISTGEGGMCVTDNPEIDKKLRLLRSHGMTTSSYQRAGGHSTKYDIVALGYNFRMDDIRANLGIAQLKKLPADLKKRAKVRAWYEELLKDIDVIVPFAGCEGFSSNYVFPICLKKGDGTYRDQVRDRIHAAGVQTSFHYPPVHQFSIYKRYKAKLPVTELVGERLITLPMYAKLTKADVKTIVKAVKESL
jgi:dTDP-4-amino-4,6-dideoxygalactose transaminase